MCVKFLAMIGAFIGWQGVFFTIFFSSVLGTLVGLPMKLAKRADVLPFGPYLAAGAVAWIFIGPDLVSWYIGLLRPGM